MSNRTDDEWLEYFAQREWGSIYDDDKYYEDHLLQDSFIVFYMYAFAHMELPSPSRTQLEIARFISNREHSHRLVWAMRRHK